MFTSQFYTRQQTTEQTSDSRQKEYTSDTKQQRRKQTVDIRHMIVDQTSDKNLLEVKT